MMLVCHTATQHILNVRVDKLLIRCTLRRVCCVVRICVGLQNRQPAVRVVVRMVFQQYTYLVFGHRHTVDWERRAR